MLSTVHFNVTEHADHIEVVRTSVAFDIGGDLYELCRPMLEFLKERNHLGLFVDLRSVAPGVGDEFEQKIKRVRQEMAEDRPRVAILVETAVGRLQVSRLLREDGTGSHVRVFSDERAAREYARDARRGLR